MKRALLAVVTLVSCVAAWAATPPAANNAIRPGLFELGLNLGEPTGISAKYWLDRTSAVEGIAAWAFTQGALSASIDYLYSFPDLIKIEKERIPLFVGLGGILRIDSAGGIALGLRVPIGVLYLFRDVPLEISADIVPGMNLFPDTRFLAMGGFAVRYCF